MKSILIASFILVSIFLFRSPSLLAQQEGITVEIAQKGTMEVHVFFVDKLIGIDEQLPLVRVEFGKVRLIDGKFSKRLFLPPQERFILKNLLRGNPKFRLYITKDKVGLYRYIKAEKDKKQKNGLYFIALHMDKDERIKEITSNVQEQASLENLLNMDLEEAGKTADKEAVLGEAINKMVQIEIDCLKSLDKKKKFTPFFIITRKSGGGA